MENRPTEGNFEEEGHDEDGDESGPFTSTSICRKKKRTNVPKQADLDEALLRTLQANETTIVDEDTNFALSLVPSLQNFTPQEKLDAKIGILNIFKQIRLARGTPSTFQTTSIFNVLQQPFSSCPVYNRVTKTFSSPQPLHTHDSQIYDL
ncbi:unnamed protein product [Leptidea sinapis]|uniref:BESS domain-containing protein n=2 Tax=Leptidea sinapis TaxID=189913 RepID=A0A5E4Q3I6_9NEOP|nr:unnamed protein product [Leptidea sinapis]